MPPKLRVYKDRALKELHDLNWGMVDAGEKLSVPFYVKNEGDGTLLDFSIQLKSAPDTDWNPDHHKRRRDAYGPVAAKLSPTPPEMLKPNEVYAGIIEFDARAVETVPQTHGPRRVAVYFKGRYAD